MIYTYIQEERWVSLITIYSYNTYSPKEDIVCVPHLLFSELYYDMYSELKSYSLYMCLEPFDHVYMHGGIPCTLYKRQGDEPPQML
jgi:hypothetical protein